MGSQFLIVDGHSIIFTWPELRKLHQKRNSLARDALVKQLTDYQDYTGVRVVLVFDGQGKKASEMLETGGIQIFFSATGQTADEVIERLVAKYAQRYDIRVATADFLEQQTATSFGAMFISPEGLKALMHESRIDFADQIKRHKKDIGR